MDGPNEILLNTNFSTSQETLGPQIYRVESSTQFDRQNYRNIFHYRTIESTDYIGVRNIRTDSFEATSLACNSPRNPLTSTNNLTSQGGSNAKKKPRRDTTQSRNRLEPSGPESDFHSFVNRTFDTSSTGNGPDQKKLDHGNRLSYSEVLLGIFLPPFQIKKKIGCNNCKFFCNFQLWFLGPVAVFYVFSLMDIKWNVNLQCILAPPFSFCCKKKFKKKKFCKCAQWCLLGWIPGMIYAYRRAHLSINRGEI